MAEGCDTAARRERAFLAGAAAGLFVVLTAPWLLIRVEFRDVKNTPWDCCVRGQVVEIWVLGRQIYQSEVLSWDQLRRERWRLDLIQFSLLAGGAVGLIWLRCWWDLRIRPGMANKD